MKRQHNTFEEMHWRGLIAQQTSPELPELLNSPNPLTFYVGIDPTAVSLHVGQLVVLNLVRLLAKNGLQPIIVMGVATGMIGDPSGRSSERVLLDQQQIAANLAKLQRQIESLLQDVSDKPPIIVNNNDWLGKLTFIDFMRDIGKNFSLSQMLSKESVSSRLQKQGTGITYTEFSYMALQAYDFWHLYQNYNCQLQIGGSDQWGNIVTGIDLIRRLGGGQAYGLTMPLLTKADGQKFGKSAVGTVWLDPDLTTPYQFYQFFIRQSDAEVIKYLKVLTLLDVDVINEAAEKLKENPQARFAQKLLANYLLEMVHGKEQLQLCQKAVEVLFGGDLSSLPLHLLEDVFAEVPSFDMHRQKINQGLDLLDLVVSIGACRSKSAARQLIAGGGLYINNIACQDTQKIQLTHLLFDKLLVIRTGKKNYFLVRFTD